MVAPIVFIVVKLPFVKALTVSENEPFNTIVQMIGKTKVNRWIRKNGFRKTKVVHDVGLAANSTIVRSGRKGNTTTVVDCGKFLEMVYRGKCVNKRYSKLMLKLLKKQQRRDKIPAGVPSRVVVANKTGETDEVSHDAAIVYAKKAPYIIVVCHIPLFDDRPGAYPGDIMENFASWQRPSARMWGPFMEDAGVQLVIAAHEHAFRFDPATESRCWAQVVGGGPELEQNTTIMIGEADSKSLKLTVEKMSDHSVLGQWEFAPRRV